MRAGLARLPCYQPCRVVHGMNLYVPACLYRNTQHTLTACIQYETVCVCMLMCLCVCMRVCVRRSDSDKEKEEAVTLKKAFAVKRDKTKGFGSGNVTTTPKEF